MLRYFERVQESLREKFDALRMAYLHARAGSVSRAPTEAERRMILTLRSLFDAGYPVSEGGMGGTRVSQ